MARLVNTLKSIIGKSRRPKPCIFNIEAFNNNIKDFKKTFIKASKHYKKEFLNSLLILAVATFIINIIILFNYKKLLILSLVKKSNNILFGLIAINKKEKAKKYAILQGFDTHFINRTILIKAPNGLSF